MRDDMPHSLSGTSLIIAASTLIALTLIRAWVVDTRQEKEELADQRRSAAAQERKYFALQAALEGEMTRMRQDINAEQARITQTLAVEREAMQAKLEEDRLELSKEAFRAGVEMERAGLLKPEEPEHPANLIPFPSPHPEPEQNRSREHGVVGP